jgi:hypothetical protein
MQIDSVIRKISPVKNTINNIVVDTEMPCNLAKLSKVTLAEILQVSEKNIVIVAAVMLDVNIIERIARHWNLFLETVAVMAVGKDFAYILELFTLG